MKRFLILSTCLHLTVALTLFYQPDVNKKSAIPIQIEYLSGGGQRLSSPTEKSAAKVNSPTESQRVSRTKTKNPLPKASELLPTYNHEQHLRIQKHLAKARKTSGSKTGSFFGKGNDSYGPNGSMTYMNNLSLEKYTPMLPFFNELYARINNHIDYPDDFIKQRLTGTITIETAINEKGVIVKPLDMATNDNVYLQSYVAAAISLALARPISKKRWMKEKQIIPLSLTVEFNIYSFPEFASKDSVGTFKNSAHFYRHRYLPPKALQVMESYIPIVPIPGGFYINFVTLYKLVAEESLAKQAKDRRTRIRRDHKFYLNQVSRQ